MSLITLGALTAGGLLLCSEYEKKQLKVRRYEISHRKIPESFDGVRLVMLADLHARSFGEKNNRLYEEIRALAPDYILTAGDMILKTQPFDTEETARFLGKLAGLCPVYCGNDNHELKLRQIKAGRRTAYDWYTDSLRKKGVRVLSDETAVLERAGGRIDVTGLDLGLAYYGKGFHVPMRPDYLVRKLGEPAEGRFHILLGHYPNYFPEYAAWGADLILAGHMHGGTVRLPSLGGLMSPNYEFFPAYDRGLYRQGRSAMVVSGGLGTHSINVRVGGNYPEISLICLRRKGQARQEKHGNQG